MWKHQQTVGKRSISSPPSGQWSNKSQSVRVMTCHSTREIMFSENMDGRKRPQENVLLTVVISEQLHYSLLTSFFVYFLLSFFCIFEKLFLQLIHIFQSERKKYNCKNSPSIQTFKSNTVKTYIYAIKKASKTLMIHKSQELSMGKHLDSRLICSRSDCFAREFAELLTI